MDREGKKFFAVTVVRQISREILSATEKLTLILLLEYRSCKSVFVSASKIAEEGSMSVSTVERAFRKFQHIGIMKVERTRKGHAYRYLKIFDLERIKLLTCAGPTISPNRSLSHEQQNKFSDCEISPGDI